MTQFANQLAPSHHQTSEPFELRPYQQHIISELYKLLRQGTKRILAYAPTGSGKTAIACRVMLHAASRGRRILFIIHRDPLVEQTRASLIRDGIAPELIGILKAGYKEDRSRPIQIASVQTLARRKFPEGIELIVADECHTVCWFDTYAKIKAAYPEAWQIGLTASPWRLKSKTEYFGQHFDAIVLGPSPKQLIKAGNLVSARCFSYGGIDDFSKIKVDKSGDYDEKQMQSFFMQPENLQKLLAQVQKLCDERTGVIFCSGVEHSRAITELLNTNGIVTEHLEADTPHKERHLMYARLAAGETRFLSSVGTLTEGFDVPSVSVVVLARATQSLALYIQMAGRGLRISPNTGKKDCLLLDFGANIARHGFITKEHKITLEPDPLSTSSMPMKECPECSAVLSVLEMVCPECGYEFPSGDEDDKAEAFEQKFGELFDDETWEMVRYLRQQRKTRFTKRQPPDALWDTFSRKFPGQILAPEWLLGSIFNEGICWQSNRQQFIDYLHEVSTIKPSKPEWVKFHEELEFGVEGRQYNTGKTQSYTVRCDNWWDVLRCDINANWDEIKIAYRYIAKEYHPDTSLLSVEEATAQMQRVNAAFELAKRERKLAKTNPISQDKVEAELAALANKPDDSALVALKVLRYHVGFETVNLAFKAIYKRDRLTGRRIYQLVEKLTAP